MLLYDVNYILQLLQCVDLGDVADISEVHAACSFSVKVCKMDEFLCAYVETRSCYMLEL